MPTAQEQNLIEGSSFGTPLKVGDKLELSGVPEFGTSEKFSCDQVQIPTLEGLRSTTSATVIGQLRSDNAKSVGGLLTKALENKSTLTVWVVENLANTGRKGMALSIFEPRS